MQHQTFFFNTKCLLWALFKILYLGDIFLLSRNNKNIIPCKRKKIKLFFFMWHKKFNVFQRFLCITNFLNSIFTLDIDSMMIFFVEVLKTKKLLMFIHLPETRKELLRAAVEKRCSYYLGLIFVKCCSYFSNIVGFLLQLFQKHEHSDRFKEFNYNHSQDILEKLQSSCEAAHHGKSSATVFQEIFTSTDKTFISGRGLSTSQ